MKQRLYCKNRDGFSLIETFVAITILMVVILGPLSAVAKFFKDNTLAKNQVVAGFLAEEAEEMTINIIRNQVLVDGGNRRCPGEWLNDVGGRNLSHCISGTCNVNAHASSGSYFVRCTESDIYQNNTCRLYRDTGFFLPNSAFEPTIFTRSIKIVDKTDPGSTDSTDPLEAQITVTVKWWDNGVPVKFVGTSYVIMPRITSRNGCN